MSAGHSITYLLYASKIHENLLHQDSARSLSITKFLCYDARKYVLGFSFLLILLIVNPLRQTLDKWHFSVLLLRRGLQYQKEMEKPSITLRKTEKLLFFGYILPSLPGLKWVTVTIIGDLTPGKYILKYIGSPHCKWRDTFISSSDSGKCLFKKQMLHKKLTCNIFELKTKSYNSLKSTRTNSSLEIPFWTDSNKYLN